MPIKKALFKHVKIEDCSRRKNLITHTSHTNSIANEDNNDTRNTDSSKIENSLGKITSEIDN